MSDKPEKCIYCGCTRNENGKWVTVLSEAGDPANRAYHKTICASCSVVKFPQYYQSRVQPGVWLRLKSRCMSIISNRQG